MADFAVQTRQLRKAYQAGEQELLVLRGVDLDIRKGEFVSVMGPSGSGKSTLLNLIGLLDAPTDGAIRLLGTETQAMTAKQRALMRRQALGFVFQSFNLMPRLTALENVLLPMAIAGVPRRERKPKALALLDSVGLGDRVDHLPSELSGGQKQRVAIARALALDPPILLADEPTGNLDSKTSTEVMQLFVKLHAKGRTIIQVTHDEDMASFGTRTIRFRDGVIESQHHVPMTDFSEPSFFLSPPRSKVAAAKKVAAEQKRIQPVPSGVQPAASRAPVQGKRPPPASSSPKTPTPAAAVPKTPPKATRTRRGEE